MSSTRTASEGVLLADCNQNSVLNALGHCHGITSFWLCLNLIFMQMAKPKNMEALAKLQTQIIRNITTNYNDAKSLYDAQSTINSKPTRLQELKTTTLAQVKDASFLPCLVFKANISTQLPICLNIAINISSSNAFINFGFNWTTPQLSNQYPGHAIGIIRNPTPDCAVLFFDCNYSVLGFNSNQNFYDFLSTYFSRYLGSTGTPFAYQTRLLLSPSLLPTSLAVSSVSDRKSSPSSATVSNPTLAVSSPSVVSLPSVAVSSPTLAVSSPSVVSRPSVAASSPSVVSRPSVAVSSPSLTVNSPLSRASSASPSMLASRISFYSPRPQRDFHIIDISPEDHVIDIRPENPIVALG